MKIKQDYLLKTIGNETIIVPVRDEAVRFNGVITVNKTAAFLFQLLQENEYSEVELISSLLEKYDVDETRAKKDVQAKYSEGKGANDWANYDENYVIIISGTSTSYSGCKRFTYGVGFGNSRSEALEKAVKSLKSRNWDASDDYNIELDKSY